VVVKDKGHMYGSSKQLLFQTSIFNRSEPLLKNSSNRLKHHFKMQRKTALTAYRACCEKPQRLTVFYFDSYNAK